MHDQYSEHRHRTEIPGRKRCRIIYWLTFALVTVITLHAKLSGAVYCNRSCLFVGLFVCLWVVYYHENSKSRASILTKLGL